MGLQSTHRRVKSPAVAARLTEHIDQLHDVIQEIRTAIFDLQADPVGTPRLRTVLHDLITGMTAETAVRTTVRMSGPVDAMPPALAHHAQAVVQEAVSNAIRHARATELTVTVSMDDDVVIDVLDDGVGIPETVARSGLHNLAQRAVGLGGSCTVTSPPGGGTRLTWTAPLPE